MEAPVESPWTLSHVVRNDEPLRTAYKKIRASLIRDQSDEECLQMAVKAVSDSVGPEGVRPTLFVFGTIP